MNNKKTISILMIFTIIFTVIGGSLAYWNWNTSEAQKTNVVFTINKDFSCAVDGGGNITSNDVKLAPTTCTDTTRAIKREVKVTPTLNSDGLTIYMDLWLDVNVMGSGLSASNNFKYVLTTSSTSCEDGTIVSSGTFTGTNTGSKVKLLSGKDYSSSTTDTYYLYIWLDAAEEDSATMNQAFSLSLNGSCSDTPPPYSESILNGGYPILDEGMIPVTIANDGTVTTIKDSDSGWYSYENKEWANAVVVGNDYRNAYRGTTGVEVNEDHILGYYVWIPRYRYQVWTTTTSAKGKEQEIQVIFEDADTSMSAGTSVGSYRTHPAFWWDDNSDGNVDAGETIAGIWVGKFETTGNATTPTVKPNVASLRSQNVSTQFATAQKFSAYGNGYGLSYTSTNAHMMKNSEWGAVAYLSHSEYGINQEIYINNSFNFFTGRSGGGVGSDVSSSTLYGNYTWLGQNVDTSGNIAGYASNRTLGTYASTTGNVTGVYDMSGGSWEYVMGNYSNTIGSSNFLSMPAKKYYDQYTFYASNSCTLATCGGHALYETNAWYEDSAGFVSSTLPWFVRSGDYSKAASAGVFLTGRSGGAGGLEYSWRSVLVVGFGL